MHTIAAVVAAGGTGIRMDSAVPKQFLELAGKPIVFYSLEKIQAVEGVCRIVLVLPEQHLEVARDLLFRQSWKVPLDLVAGGPVRQESVWLGLEKTPADASLILVHDAVRPLCDVETMERVAAAAWETGAAVPAIPASDTIQRVSRRGRVLATPPREELYAIQTPQGFRTEILRSALRQARESGFVGTDESSAVRRAGHPVVVVAGSPLNIKVTRPADLALAEILLKTQSGQQPQDCVEVRNPLIRIGHGIDYHRLAAGRRLVLGGVDIPFEFGLEGHSDADALTHAVCDALLGAAALGDIGKHFPDTDPANRNRPSLEFLRAIAALVGGAGWTVQNVDATILAQKPKLAPFMECMRWNIAECLGVPVQDVSVKATTTEGLNAEGRGEGMSAHAVAVLRKL
jgi:2-C-methyl-D-erythritol 4-phosphate cytidylyltransferase / 2-C-methyl-D-erythritol 2,4-cyclodiphosphate synthase